MPLGTMDRSPPPFFRQGLSALSKLALCTALALFLMVADVRYKLTQPLRATVITLLAPLQWLARQPVLAVETGVGYFETLIAAQNRADAAQKQLAAQSLLANQTAQLTLENNRLRQLLALREHTRQPGTAAEVLYDTADPYARKVIVDRGMVHGIEQGSPVIDASGVLGQVTRVYPLVSEVTLVIDRDLAIPVLNTRTGARNVLYGEPAQHSGVLELRFLTGDADVKVGDMLTTSGVDGVYPAGLPVAQIAQMDRLGEGSFVRILCTPAARVDGARHVVVLKPLASELQLPPRPPVDTTPPPRKGARP